MLPSTTSYARIPRSPCPRRRPRRWPCTRPSGRATLRRRQTGGPPAAAAPAPLLPGRLKQLNKRRRDADGMASDGDDDAGLLDLSGGADGATEQRGRPKQLPGRLRKKLAKQRAQGD